MAKLKPDFRQSTAAMFLTLKDEPEEIHVLAKTDCGLKENSLILLEQVQTIDQYRLRDLIGTLDEEKMKEVDKALSVSVGLAK